MCSEPEHAACQHRRQPAPGPCSASCSCSGPSMYVGASFTSEGISPGCCSAFTAARPLLCCAQGPGCNT